MMEQFVIYYSCFTYYFIRYHEIIFNTDSVYYTINLQFENDIFN